MDLFFPPECLFRIIFFPGEGLLRFLFFSWGRPFQIYFFLEKGLRDFFFSISSGPPQIINGRPLRLLKKSSTMGCGSVNKRLGLRGKNTLSNVKRKLLEHQSAQQRKSYLIRIVCFTRDGLTLNFSLSRQRSRVLNRSRLCVCASACARVSVCQRSTG